MDDKNKDKKVEHVEINKEALGSTITEAWTDAQCVDEETKVNYPSKEAVNRAKEWVDQNEK